MPPIAPPERLELEDGDGEGGVAVSDENWAPEVVAAEAEVEAADEAGMLELVARRAAVSTVRAVADGEADSRDE